MPLRKGTRYRYRKISTKKRQRLAFANGKVVEVVGYKKKNGQWVKKYSRTKKSKKSRKKLKKK